MHNPYAGAKNVSPETWGKLMGMAWDPRDHNGETWAEAAHRWAETNADTPQRISEWAYSRDGGRTAIIEAFGQDFMEDLDQIARDLPEY